MIRTRVGYAGGTQKNPTYTDLGDHTESIQLDFDPAQISYDKLLEIFWKSHNPCRESGSRQYMSAVFHHSEAQRQRAIATRDAQAAREKEKIVTPILPMTEFWLAEDYHQKHSLRNRTELWKEFQAMYATEKELLNSTAVARVNGYLGGHGTLDALEKEIAGFGLSAEGNKILREAVKRRSR